MAARRRSAMQAERGTAVGRAAPTDRSGHRARGRRAPRRVQAVGAVQGSSPPVPVRGGDDAEAGPPLGDQPQQGAARRRGRERGGGRAAPPRRRWSPGRSRGRRRSGPAFRRRRRRFGDEIGARSPMRSRCRGSRRRRPPGSRHARAMPGVVVPAVASSVPGARSVDAGGSRRCRHPAGGVALRAAALDRLAVPVEPGRGAEVEAEQKACDAARLGPVAGRGQGDGDGARVARPDVGPARARSGDRGATARSTSARSTSSERRYIRRAHCGAPPAQRPSPRQPSSVPLPRGPAPFSTSNRVPSTGAPRAVTRNAGTTPGNPRGTGGSTDVPPEKATPATRTSTPSAIPARAQATCQSKQPHRAPVASLPAAQPRRRNPRRGSSVGRAHD